MYRRQLTIARIRATAAAPVTFLVAPATGPARFADGVLLRDTAAMGVLLALHLGVVFALFVTLPYGKFVHGLYRYLALLRYARERRAMAQGTMPE